MAAIIPSLLRPSTGAGELSGSRPLVRQASPTWRKFVDDVVVAADWPAPIDPGHRGMRHEALSGPDCVRVERRKRWRL